MEIFQHPLTNLRLMPPVDMTPDDCSELPVVTGTMVIEPGGAEYRFISSFWKPTAEELQKLNAGEPVQVRTLGSNFPPMLVTVGDKDFKD